MPFLTGECKAIKKMDTMSSHGQYFVTRIRKTAGYVLADGSASTPLHFENDLVQFISHKEVHLGVGGGKKTKEAFRLIEGTFKDTQDTMLLLSNLPQDTFTPEEVADIYKQRWKIETFFRF